MAETFAERFCNHHRLQPEQYRRAMLQSCFHRRALIFLPFLSRISPGHFEADYELISVVGLMRNPESFNDEIRAFHDHPHNRRFLRRNLRLRVSVKRLRRVFGSLMKLPVAAPVAKQIH